MGSIALPALDIKAPQQEDLLQKFAQLNQIKASQQAQAQNAAEAPLRMRQLNQGIQQGDLQIQQQQQEAAARQALNEAYAGAVTKDANGNPSFDEQKLMQNLSGGPAAYKSPEVMKGITDFQNSRLGLQTTATELQAKQADMIGSAAAAVKAANYDPTLAHSLLDTLPQSPQLNQIRAHIDDPASLRKIIDTAIQNSPKQRDLSVAEATQAETVKRDASSAAQAAATAAETRTNHEAIRKQEQQRIDNEARRLRQENTGTLSIAQVPDGKGGMKSVLLNNKSGELKDTDPGLIKPSGNQPGTGQPTTADRNRASLAKIALANIDKIQEIVRRRGDILGPGAGRIANIDQLIGSNDPDLVALVNEAHNFSMANAGVHGSRSVMNVRDAVKDLLGDLHNGAKGIQGGLDANRANLNSVINPNGSGLQPQASGLGVRVSDAMALPQNKGKTKEQVMQDIKSHGHTVIE